MALSVYQVIAPGGAFVVGTFYDFGAQITLTDAQAKYPLAGGVIRPYSSGDISIPPVVAPTPVPVTETNTTIPITIDHTEREVTIAQLINLFPRVMGAKGDTGPSGATTAAGLTDVVDTIKAVLKAQDLTAARANLGLGSAATYATADLPVSTATQTALNNLGTLISNNATALQTILGSADGSVDTFIEVYNRFMTDESAASAVQSALTSLQTSITNHLADHANPHGVTKTQVGLANVDNTSDANKPVSAATANLIGSVLDSVASDLNATATAIVDAVTTDLAGKAANGANSDITSLSGLTTALSVAQGGLGNATGDASGLSLPFLGPRTMTLPERLSGVVDIREWNGVDATFNNANDAIVQSWLTQAMGSGRPAYAPPGRYAMATGAVISMTGDLEVSLPRAAIFKGTSSIAVPIISYKDNGGSHRYGLTWSGGTFDNALGVFVAAAQSNVCMDFTRLNKVLIQRTIFKGASTYTAAQTTTDSGLTGVDNNQVTVTDCFFDGQGDVGIYFGGNSTAGISDDGYQIIITNNHFSNSQQAFALKREGGGALFANNTMMNMYSCINSLDASELVGGRGIHIVNNYAKYIEAYFASLRASANHRVLNNVIEDFGFLPDGVTATAQPRAIRLMGATNTKVRGNRIGLRDWTQGARGSANHAGIVIEDYTTTISGASQTFVGDGVVYDNNDFENIQTAVLEISTTAGPTMGSSNTYTNISQRLTATNASSQYRFYDITQGGERSYVGTTEVARVNSAGSLSIRQRTFLNAVGLTKIDQLNNQSITWGTLTAGTYAADQTLTFTGAVLGDRIEVMPLSAAGQPSGLELSAFCLAADQITVRAKNGGSTTLNMTTAYVYKFVLLRTG